MIVVTIKSAGMLTKSVELEEGSTYGDALAKANVSAEGKSITVSGDVVSLSDEIDDDCVIRMSKQVSGA